MKNVVTMGNTHYSSAIVTKYTREEFEEKYKRSGVFYDRIAKASGKTAKVKKAQK